LLLSIILIITQYTIKLLNLKAKSDANDFNIILEKYGLNNFQHRLLIRMATFVFNIVNVEQAPRLLKEQLILNVNINKGGYNL